MGSIPKDLICVRCGEKNLDEEACYNQKDTCVDCCIKDYGDPCGHEERKTKVKSFTISGLRKTKEDFKAANKQEQITIVQGLSDSLMANDTIAMLLDIPESSVRIILNSSERV